MKWMISVLALASCFATTVAAAQSDVLLVSPSELEVMPAASAEARLAELERAYQEVKIRGPRAGVVVSPLVIFGGVMTATAGAVANSCLFSDGSKCRTQAGNIMVGVGVSAIAAGITGLVISAIRLRRAKDQRLRLKWEMSELQGAVD